MSKYTLEDLRAKLAALERRDRVKLARFAGVSQRGVEYFVDGSTTAPSVITFEAMCGGYDRLMQYKREREKLDAKFPELAPDGDTKPGDLS